MYDFTPEHLAYYNALEQAYRDIQDNPAHWDQSTWHCETSHCLAGFCDIREAGMPFDQSSTGVAAWQGPDEECSILISISPFAQRYPYWGDHAEVFNSRNTLGDILYCIDHVRDHGFLLDSEGNDRDGNNKLDEVSAHSIVCGIKEAIEFTWPEDDRPSEFEYAPETNRFLNKYVTRFVEMLNELWPLPGSELTQVMERNDPRWDTSECLGNDIWYSTQGHGCGFWEGDSRWSGHWQACDDYCKSHPLGEAYLGDDGLVHLGVY